MIFSYYRWRYDMSFMKHNLIWSEDSLIWGNNRSATISNADDEGACGCKDVNDDSYVERNSAQQHFYQRHDSTRQFCPSFEEKCCSIFLVFWKQAWLIRSVRQGVRECERKKMQQLSLYFNQCISVRPWRGAGLTSVEDAHSCLFRACCSWMQQPQMIWCLQTHGNRWTAGWEFRWYNVDFCCWLELGWWIVFGLLYC